LVIVRTGDDGPFFYSVSIHILTPCLPHVNSFPIHRRVTLLYPAYTRALHCSHHPTPRAGHHALLAQRHLLWAAVSHHPDVTARAEVTFPTKNNNSNSICSKSLKLCQIPPYEETSYFVMGMVPTKNMFMKSTSRKNFGEFVMPLKIQTNFRLGNLLESLV
jgi:hypothetical protein